MKALRLPVLPWRHPPVEAGPVRLAARRLYILPTRAGLVFAMLLVGLLVGAINYSLSLAFLFTFLLAGIGLAGMIHTQRNLHGIDVRPGAVPPVFAGETARFTLHIENPTRLPRFRVGLNQAGGDTHYGDLPAQGSAELVLAMPQPRRGWQRPGKFTLETTYPLGLFRSWTALDLDWGVLVYPRPAEDARPLPLGGPAEPGGRLTRTGDEDFDGLREYRSGDSLRRIAWKAAARRDRPVTKQFATPQGQSLWLDWSSTPGPDTEAKLSRLTRWVLDAEGAGLAYGLRMPARTLPPGLGEAHRRQALEILARHGEDRA